LTTVYLNFEIGKGLILKRELMGVQGILKKDEKG